MSYKDARCVLAAVAFLLATMPWSSATAAERLLVDEGQPRAEIVTAEAPPRMTALAAEELQSHIEKISGATLPVVTAPSADVPLKIYIGRSPRTDALGIDDTGLEHGAFRMQTVEDGLVLLGHDEDFTPTQPHTRHRSPDHPDRIRAEKEWDALSGGHYGNPYGSRGRNYSSRMELWAYDLGGSLNAVYEFLRHLGVRWYMPGELGTIVPQIDSIPLPDVEKTVHPEFAWRRVAICQYFSTSPEDILWYLRQGFNYGNEVVGHFSHGLRTVTSRDTLKENHPEIYALARGGRLTKKNHACLTSRELFDAAVRFGRAMYDVYDIPMVSMMPQDGYQFCECPLCEGMDTPERGRDGIHSDYVWGFVNRVAQELYKTHPDKGVNCLAYGTYRQPPTNIKQLSPNVYVGIVHSRGRAFDDPEIREETLALRRAWRKMTANKLWTWEHYPFTHRSTFTPYYYPHSIAAGIQSMQDTHFGEFIEGPIGPFKERGHALHEPGFGHLNFYVTGRFQWNADQDVDALLDEYYRLFYGPAGEEMKAFIEYSEANRLDLQNDADKIRKTLDLLDAAIAAVDPESEYGRRIGLVNNYLQRLRAWHDELGRGRENVPVLDLPIRPDAELTLDGRLDDGVWDELSSYSLVDVKTGDAAKVGTWFKIYWDGGEREGHIVIGVHCNEPDMQNLRMLTQDTGDWRVFGDDNLDLLIETQAHSYYQIAINASGAYVDMDRHLRRMNDDWTSLAETAAYRGDDFWSVEVRLPVTGEETPGDPLHELAGWRPSPEAPWHITIGRQRLRGEEKEWTAWSPTGSNFHDIMRFGRVE